MIHASLLTLKARLSSQRTILLVGFLVGILALGTGLRDRNSERGDPEVATLRVEKNAEGFSLDARNASLYDVLNSLAKTSGIEVEIDPVLKKQKITLRAEVDSLEEFVRGLDENYSLEFVREGDSVRLVAARLSAPDDTPLAARPVEQPVSPSGEAADIAARTGLGSERPEVAAALRSTPGELGLLSNADRPLHQYRRRGGSPALIMANAILDTRAKIDEGKDWPIPRQFRAAPSTTRYIVQFDGPVSNTLRAGIEGMGGDVTHYVPNNAYAVRLSPEQREQMEARPDVLLVEPHHPYLKLSPHILSYLSGTANDTVARRVEAGTYMVMLFNSLNPDEVLAPYNVNILRRQTSGERSVVTVSGDPRVIEKLIFDDGVQFIEPEFPRKAMNDLAGPVLRTTFFKNTSGLDGSGVIVGITDSGVDVTHRGFSVDPDSVTGLNTNTRIIAYEARDGSSDGIIGDADGHGTHVSGSVLGNGALSETAVLVPGSGTGPYESGEFAGMAPKAQLVMIEDFNSFTDEEQAQLAWDHGARLSNNSWGASLFTYGLLSAVWDSLVRDADQDTSGNQQISFFFAAGNSGGGPDDGTGGSAGTIGSPGNSKNVITVGAIENLRLADNLAGALEQSDSDWQVAGFSSRGPVSGADFRMKPDVVSPGGYVLSAQSADQPQSPDDFLDPLDIFERDLRNNNVDTGPKYSFNSGTSMAAPVTTGNGALIYEYFTEILGRDSISPALMKAVLISGARNLNSFIYTHPIFLNAPAIVHQGWGRVDLTRSIRGPQTQPADKIIFLDQDQTTPLVTDQIWSFPLTIGQGEGGLKVTISWTDPPGTPGTGPVLVNNLDLLVRAADDSGWRGNFWSPDGLHAEKLDPVDGFFADEVNNVEVINVPDLSPGEYTVEVLGAEVALGPQDFACVIVVGEGIVGRTAGQNHDMVLADDDGAVVAYEDLDTGEFQQIYLKKWRGAIPVDPEGLDAWKLMEEQWFGVGGSIFETGISQTPDPSMNPSVAVRGDNIFVAWEQETSATNSPITIYGRLFDGSQWIALGDSARGQGIVNNQVLDTLDPVVAIGADGFPIVAYQIPVSPFPKVYLRKWDGNAWIGLGTSASTGIPGTVHAQTPAIAVDSIGRVIVVWDELSVDRVRVRRWNGAAWETFDDVGFAPNARQPDVAIGPNDQLYVAFQQFPDFEAGQFFIQAMMAVNVGTSWVGINNSYTYPGISNANGDPRTAIEPRVDVNANGTVMIAWQQTTTGRAVIVRSPSGGTWSGVSGAGDAPGVADLDGTSLRPIIGVDSLGVPVVVFQNNGDDLEEIVGYTITKDRVPPSFSGLASAIGSSSNDVLLSWAPGFDLSVPITYTVYRSTGSFPCGFLPNCDEGDIFSNPIGITTGTTFTVGSLLNGRVYCFAVRAEDGTGLQDGNSVIRSAGPISGVGDLDTDCLDNLLEVAALTEVCLPDTDVDGMWDGWEWAFSTNNPSYTSPLAMDPLDNGFENVRTIEPDDGTPLQLADEDLDGDGASNLEEFQWWFDNTGANCDIANTSPDPTRVDTDGDNIPDGWEIFNDLDPTDPSDAGLDPDGDGLVNSNEFAAGGDPTNSDSDNDGIDDGAEFVGGTLVNRADSDLDGLDDGFEMSIGTDPTDWDSNDNQVSDGDIYQLGFDDPNAALTNLNLLGCWDFESPESTTNWTHLAPNPAAPFDLWHLSSADPDPVQSGDSILEVNERTVTTAWRLANDPSGSDVDATYNFANLKVIADLVSPPIDASSVANIYVSWNEFVDTEAGMDLTRVFVQSPSNIVAVPISPAVSGPGAGWVHRTADFTAFAGEPEVRIIFRFQTINSQNQNFRGWWVDDVKVYETASISGWVRSKKGAPIQEADVLLQGRGGVTNRIDGHAIVKAGKIFKQTRTVEDGSYTVRGMPFGNYYVKADSRLHAAEFWNGPLMTNGYSFGGHLNPGVGSRELAEGTGALDLTYSGGGTNAPAPATAYFELGVGISRACLGIGAEVVNSVTINDLPAEVWNGVGTPGGAQMIPYLADPSNPLTNQFPDWIDNPVQPNLLCDLMGGGPFLPYVENTGVLYPIPGLDVREADTTLLILATNQAEGRLFVNSDDGQSHPIVIDGQASGLTTPANVVIRAGDHRVKLAPAGGAKWVTPKAVTVPIGGRARLDFSTEDLAGAAGSLQVKTVDLFDQSITGATVYVDGVRVTSGDTRSGNSTTPLTVEGIQSGSHAVTVVLDGFLTVPAREVALASDNTALASFSLFEGDRDYDQVGDGTEIAGYTNVFLFARNDDPDNDGLTNLKEFEQFALHGVVLNIFDPDTDDDLLTDGEEIGFDGNAEYFGLSMLWTNAAVQTQTVNALFSGCFLDGIEFFENGHYIAAIECDQFDAGSITQGVAQGEAVPTDKPVVTLFQDIPAFPNDARVSTGHPLHDVIYSDTFPDAVDTDGDGLWDGFEKLYDSTVSNGTVTAQLNPLMCGRADEDPDGDELSNLAEFLGPDGIANTNDMLNPIDFDTDNDFMPDGFEMQFGLNPLDPADNVLDPDGDGLSNLGEFLINSSPQNADTDGDFLPDGAEVDFGSDPNSIDTDQDGLIDGREVWDKDMDGVFDGGFFNTLPGSDFDGDGFPDGPTDFDSDGDGMPDGFEVLEPSFGQPYEDLGVFTPECRLNPLDPLDADLDCDFDGLSNLQEFLVRDAQYGNDPLSFDPELNPISVAWRYSTDPFLHDTDEDGMPDGFEVMHGLHPQEPVPATLTGDFTNRFAEGSSLSIDGDLDSDGLWNLREYEVRFRLDPDVDPYHPSLLSTHPWLDDTDEDGLLDGEEDRIMRSNPLNEDTDGDRLIDGSAVSRPDAMGEIETVMRTNMTEQIVSNHFDQALNDLWMLTWLRGGEGEPTRDDLPTWVEVTISSNSPAPPARWGQAAYYDPINVWVDDGEGNVQPVLDNRSLVVLGGRDGVTRFSDAWQFSVRSNSWRLIESMTDSNIVLSGSYASTNGLSEFSAIPFFSEVNTAPDLGPDITCEARPGSQRYLEGLIGGGWNNLYTYRGNERSQFFKGEDTPLDLIDFVVSVNDVLETASGAVTDSVSFAGTDVIPIGSGFTDEAGDAWVASAWHFTLVPAGGTEEEAGLNLGAECAQVFSAEVIFDVLEPPTNDLIFEFVFEVSSLTGDSPDTYIPQEGTAPSQRIDVPFFNSAAVTATVPSGVTGEIVVDATEAFVELQGVFNGTNFGVVATSTNASTFAYVAESATAVRITTLPLYFVSKNFPTEPNWRAPSTMIGINTSPTARSYKSSPLAYDWDAKTIVQFGGIDGNEIFNDTFEGLIVDTVPDDFQIDSLTWTLAGVTNVVGTVPEARYGHSMIYDHERNQVFMFGGFNADHKPLNDIWSYTHENDTWTEITSFQDAQRPHPRGGAAMVMFGGSEYTGGDGRIIYNEKNLLVLFGGTDGDVYFNDTWIFDPDYNSESIETTKEETARWVLSQPHGENGGPPGRAFGTFVFAQNGELLIDPDTGEILGDSGGISCDLDGGERDRSAAVAYLFGGRSGTLPTGRDSDDDDVEDGVEHELGGPAVGRDPRVNALVDTNSTEVIPYAYKRIGAALGLFDQDIEPATARSAIANFESLSYEQRYHGVFNDLPFQGYPNEGPLSSPTFTVLRSGYDGFLPGYTNQWWHRFGGQETMDPRDVWQLGTPNNSVVGVEAAPEFAYRGRWVFGTDLDGNYPNDAIMELYSPAFSLTLPAVDSVFTNVVISNSWFLSFHEWLDLEDANDFVRVDTVRPTTTADLVTRDPLGTNRPPVLVLGDRNSGFNTDQEWRKQVLPLDQLGGETNIYLRFSLTSDSSGVAGGWYIDNVAIFQAGQIGGTILDENDQPVVGADVTLIGANFNQNVLDTTFTDALGRYQFGPLPFGHYQVVAGEDVLQVHLTPENNDATAVPQPGLMVTSITNPQMATITWGAMSGSVYQVEVNMDMGTTNWVQVGSLTASNVVEMFTDPAPPPTNAFYRVLRTGP